ncbi:MAG: MFS transporter [Actinomycetota bacterium]|nr:MFS transporter [Actinomycetota bacterium]
MSRAPKQASPPQSPSPLTVPEFRSLLPIGFTVALGFGLVVPVLAPFALSFGVGIALMGLVQFVFGFTRFSFGIAAGLVVDRFGERASTVTGILIVAVSSYAAGFAQSFPQLVLARGFGGAGSALFIAGLMNRLLKIIPAESMGRATGLWRASFLVGIAIGPVIGGVLKDQLGFRAPFHIYATGLLIAATIAWFVMTAPLKGAKAQKKRPIEALRATRPLFRDVRYVVALLATLVGWWTLSGPTQQIGAVYAQRVLDFSGTKFGLALFLLSIGEVIVLFTAGKAADRYGRKAVLIPALAVTAIATALLGQVETLPNAFFPLMIAIGAGVAAGGVAAGGLLADSVPEGGSGTAVSVNQMAGDLGYMIAPAAVGAIAQGGGFSLAYGVAAVPAAVAFAAALKLPPGAGRGRRDRGSEGHEPVG